MKARIKKPCTPPPPTPLEAGKARADSLRGTVVSLPAQAVLACLGCRWGPESLLNGTPGKVGSCCSPPGLGIAKHNSLKTLEPVF